MNEAEIWLVILAGMLMTYLTRLSFVALIPKERLPLFLLRGLTYIPSAVLAAILLPELVFRGELLDLSLSNDHLVAGAVAALIGWRLKNTWLTIASGLIALWLLSAI